MDQSYDGVGKEAMRDQDLIKLNDVFLHDPFPTLLHIIFVNLMTINDVNLSFVFRRINSLNT
jgi:hypothetical protein